MLKTKAGGIPSLIVFAAVLATTAGLELFRSGRPNFHLTFVFWAAVIVVAMFALAAILAFATIAVKAIARRIAR